MWKSGISKIYAIVIAAIILIAAIVGAVWYTMQGTPTTSKQFKFAAIMPGPVSDGDYNTIGLLAVSAVTDSFGIPVTYSERVAVPNSEQVMRQYISDGYNIIWVHGAQFNSYALKLASEFPDVTFICEIDAPIANRSANIWELDKKLWYGHYAIGALGALQTKANTIGFIVGANLPWVTGVLNSMKQAIDTYNPNATLKHIIVGDFNDPLKARLATDSMIVEGADFLVGDLNMGVYGLFEACRASGRNGSLWVTGFSTDKRDLLSAYYVTGLVQDFSIPVTFAVNKTINNGQTGGYTSLEFGVGKGQYIKLPLNLVSPDVEATVESICQQLEAGTINVVKNLTGLTF